MFLKEVVRVWSYRNFVSIDCQTSEPSVSVSIVLIFWYLDFQQAILLLAMFSTVDVPCQLGVCTRNWRLRVVQLKCIGNNTLSRLQISKYLRVQRMSFFFTLINPLIIYLNPLKWHQHDHVLFCNMCVLFAET